jgi:hypothetical protein
LEEGYIVFMPNRLIVWVSGREEGNPMSSIEMNNQIKRVKKKEVRKQGQPSKAKRPLTVEEWKTMKKIFANYSRDNCGGVLCTLKQIFSFTCLLASMTPALRFCLTTSKSTTRTSVMS